MASDFESDQTDSENSESQLEDFDSSDYVTPFLPATHVAGHADPPRGGLEEWTDAMHRPPPTCTSIALRAGAFDRVEFTSTDVETSLHSLGGISGFIAAAIVDADTRVLLGCAGGTADFDIRLAGTMNAEVVKAKRRAARALGLDACIDDILVTITNQYHLIRPLKHEPSIFVYLALSRVDANLGMARFALARTASWLDVQIAASVA